MNLVPVRIVGPSIAGAAAFQSTSFAPRPIALSGPRRMGQTEQTWYARAKAAMAKFDNELERAGRISNVEERKRLLDRYADPKGWPIRIRDSVAAAIAEAESKTPIDYSVFARPNVPVDIQSLEMKADSLGQAVAEAEALVGLLPRKPVDWKPVLVLGAIVIGATIASFSFGGGQPRH